MTDARTEPRWWGVLERVEVPLGLTLIGIGFMAVGLGWLEASATADVRIQMQDLISGAIGGLAMVVAGSTLLVCAVLGNAGRRLERVLDVRVPSAPVESEDVRPLVATSASYHRADCDLLDDRDDAVPLQRDAASHLSACRVCAPGVRA